MSGEAGRSLMHFRCPRCGVPATPVHLAAHEDGCPNPSSTRRRQASGNPLVPPATEVTDTQKSTPLSDDARATVPEPTRHSSTTDDVAVAVVFESLRHHVEHVPKARKAAEDAVWSLRKMGLLPAADVSHAACHAEGAASYDAGYRDALRDHSITSDDARSTS